MRNISVGKNQNTMSKDGSNDSVQMRYMKQPQNNQNVRHDRLYDLSYFKMDNDVTIKRNSRCNQYHVILIM